MFTFKRYTEVVIASEPLAFVNNPFTNCVSNFEFSAAFDVITYLRTRIPLFEFP